MIVRARRRRLEDVSPDLACCDRAQSEYKFFPIPEYEIDLSTAHKSMITCRACGRIAHVTIVAITRFLVKPPTPTKINSTFLESVDLDEGPVEPGNPRSTQV